MACFTVDNISPLETRKCAGEIIYSEGHEKALKVFRIVFEQELIDKVFHHIAVDSAKVLQ